MDLLEAGFNWGATSYNDKIIKLFIAKVARIVQHKCIVKACDFAQTNLPFSHGSWGAGR